MAKKGKKLSEEHKIKIGLANKGKIRSDKIREKISKAKIGHKSGMLGKKHSEETKQKLRTINLGKKQSKEQIEKRTVYVRGEKNWNWKGGITPINIKIRNSLEYKIWRKSVFERDNWTCVWCKKRGGKLNADHIKSFAHYPELRFAIDNGRTLCVDCHKTTDTYLNRW